MSGTNYSGTVQRVHRKENGGKKSRIKFMREKEGERRGEKRGRERGSKRREGRK